MREEVQLEMERRDGEKVDIKRMRKESEEEKGGEEKIEERG